MEIALSEQDERQGRRLSFLGEQDYNMIYSDEHALLMDDDEYDTLAARLLGRIECMLEYVETNGCDVPEEELPTQTELKSLARGYMVGGTFIIDDHMRDDDDVDNNIRSHGKPTSFNRIRENNITPFKTLDDNYAKLPTLIKLEQRVVTALGLHSPDNVRSLVISYGDGAPNATRSLADCRRSNPLVIWRMGSFHKRNNTAENICTIGREPIFESYLKHGGMKSVGRRDYFCSLGHVRRSVDRIVALLNGNIWAAIVAFRAVCCGPHWPSSEVDSGAEREACGMMETGGAAAGGGEGEGEDKEEDTTAAAKRRRTVTRNDNDSTSGSTRSSNGSSSSSSSASSNSSSSNSNSSSDNSNASNDSDSDSDSTSSCASSASMKDSARILSPAEQAEVDEDEGRQQEVENELHDAQFAAEQRRALGESSEDEDGDDEEPRDGGGEGETDDEWTTSFVAVNAVNVLEFMLRQAENTNKDMTRFLFSILILVDTMEAFAEAWKAGNTLRGHKLNRYAVRVSASLDFAKGADLYARIDVSQQVQFDCASLYHQAIMIMTRTLKGETCDVAPDFFVETLQRIFKSEARLTAGPHLLHKYQETSLDLAGTIDRRNAARGQSTATARRGTSHGINPPSQMGPLDIQAKLWAEEHCIWTDGAKVVDDAGDDIEGFQTLVKKVPINRQLLQVMEIGNAVGVSDVKRRLFPAVDALPVTSNPTLAKMKPTVAAVESCSALRVSRRKLQDVESLCRTLTKKEKQYTGRSMVYTEAELVAVAIAYWKSGKYDPKKEEQGRGAFTLASKLNKRGVANIVSRARAKWRRKQRSHELIAIEQTLDDATRSDGAAAADPANLGISITKEVRSALVRIEANFGLTSRVAQLTRTDDVAVSGGGRLQTFFPHRWVRFRGSLEACASHDGGSSDDDGTDLFTLGSLDPAVNAQIQSTLADAATRRMNERRLFEAQASRTRRAVAQRHHDVMTLMLDRADRMHRVKEQSVDYVTEVWPGQTNLWRRVRKDDDDRRNDMEEEML